MWLTDDHVYENILYGLLYKLGPREPDSYILDNIMLFKSSINIGEEKHVQLLEKAETRSSPKHSLIIEIIELNGVSFNHMNGLCNPYVKLLVADSKKRIITKPEKIKRNYFSVPLNNLPNDDNKLNLEVRKRRSLICFRFVKEVIGTYSVDLNSVPISGLDKVYTLRKNETITGKIRLKLSYKSDSKKDKQDAFQEHRYLFEHFLFKELDKTQESQTYCNGKFSTNIEGFLSQHQAQNCLTDVDIALIKWTIYTEIQQQENRISSELFVEVLSILEEPILMTKITSQETDMFWKSTCRHLPSCLDLIRKARKNLDEPERLKNVLRVLSKLANFKAPQDFDMFPRKYYGWLRKNDNMNIHSAVEQAIILSTNQHFYAFVDSKIFDSDDPEAKVKHCIEVIEMATSDIKEWNSLNQLFKEYLNINPVEMIYKIYDKKMKFHFHPAVSRICLEGSRINHGLFTKLIKFCLTLHRFVHMTPLNQEVIVHETDTSIFDLLLKFGNEILFRLEKYLEGLVETESDSTELYFLKDLSSCSSSSENIENIQKFSKQIRDLTEICEEIILFKKKNGYYLITTHDVIENCYTYVCKLADFTDKLLLEKEHENFKIPCLWNVIIFDILCFFENHEPFDIDEIKLANYEQLDEQDHFDLISDAIEIIREKFNRQMDPEITKILKDNCSDCSPNAINLLMEKFLREVFKTVPLDYFDQVHIAIWNYLIVKCMKLQKSPEFFVSLRQSLKRIVENVDQNETETFVTYVKPSIEKIDNLLELYGQETNQLTHRFNMKRHSIQNHESEYPFDSVKGQIFFDKTELRFEKISIEFITIEDSRSKHKSSLVIRLFPEDKFGSIQKLRTFFVKGQQIISFKAKYKFHLTEEQRNVENAMIMISVVNKNFGLELNYAETFLMLKDIVEKNGEKKPPEICLKLTNPPENEEFFENVKKILSMRAEDERAKVFLDTLSEPTALEKIVKSNCMKRFTIIYETVCESKIVKCFNVTFKCFKCCLCL